jgi:hypothetical protein
MMTKTLRQSIPLLSLAGLRDFAARQVNYRDEVKRLIAGAEAAIAKIQADAVPFLTGGVKKINNLSLRISSPADSVIQAQVADRKYKVRQALDAQLIPLFKKMVAAKALAKEYAERHWSKPQVLSRATTGNGTTEGIQRRAAYAAIFASMGRAALFDAAQECIDTGDAVKADALYRAICSLPRDERPCQPAEFISLVPNAEYTEATAVLQSVLDATDQAGLAIATFEGKTGKVSISKIALGLAGQGDKLKPEEDMLDAAGGIRDEWVLEQARRASGKE